MEHISHPIKDFSWKQSVSQLFGVSAELYEKFGIPGHNGVDYRFPLSAKHGYGEPVCAAHDGKVVKIFSDFPNKTQGTGIYLHKIIHTEFPERIMESIYWHLSDVDVKVGDEVKQGEIIGKIGNTGYVFPLPTEDDPWLGSHLHFALRFYKNGEVEKTEYDGFVDPVPYLWNDGEKLPVILYRDLFVGSQGNEVAHLHTLLKLEGYAVDYEPMPFFGLKTRRDVAELQKANAISPSYGYCGQKTRDFLLAKYQL